MRIKCLAGIFLFFVFVQSARGDIDTVFARDFSFMPSTLTIKAGDTVVWKSVLQCCVPHTSSRAASPKPWNSGSIPLNGTFTLVFSVADSGTFSYFCQPHLGLGMTGTIIALPIETVPAYAGALNYLGLAFLGLTLAAAAIWVLERRRRLA
jgi:plastocyanin